MAERDRWPLASDEHWWSWPGAPEDTGEVLLRTYPVADSVFVEARTRHFEQPIGFIHFSTERLKAQVYVEHLAVRGNWRRKGLGRALVGYVEHWAKLNGCGLIVLSAFSGPARDFWEAVGYVPQAEHPSLYEKRLDGQ